MGPASWVLAARVVWRVNVVKSARRILTVTVRPLISFRSRLPATRSAKRSRTSFSSASSARSAAKVVSAETDLVSRSVCTGSRSSPTARSRTAAARTPKVRTNQSMGCSANWPMVSTPPALSLCAVLGPMPHSLPTASGAKNRASSPGGTTTRPSGLSRSEAILATDLLVATPTDTARPVSSTTRRFKLKAIPSGHRPCSSSTASVMSR